MTVDRSERIVRSGDVELAVVDAGDRDAPHVVLVHGWPELAYSWRHQIEPLVRAGYRVLAPDMRGYGRSSRPDAVEAYDIEHLTGDLVALLDDVGRDDAVFVGHDWGAMVTWQMALLHPDRVRGVVGCSVPFTPRSQRRPIETLRATFGDSFFYILYFQEPGVADADLGADPRTTLRRLFGGMSAGDQPGLGDPSPDGRGLVERIPEPDRLPSWITEEELDHYVAEFTRTGFTGGLNWYRNFDRNWELTPHLADATVDVPSAFIGGSKDPVLLLRSPDSQLPFLTDFRGATIIDGAGHWVQQEAPDPVNEAILGFLGSLDPGS